VSESTDLAGLLKRSRGIVEPVADSIVWIGALLATTALRFDLNLSRTLTVGVFDAILIVIAAQVLVGLGTALYRIRWKNASFEETVALATTTSIATVILVAANVVLLHHAVPVSSIVAAGAFTFVGAGGLRAGWRLIHEYRTEGLSRPRRAIIFGAGSGGEQVIDALRNSASAPFLPVALLDDSPKMHNVQLRHLRVSGGREQIPEVAERLKADTLIVAIATASSGMIRELSHRAHLAGLELRVLPPVTELLGNPAVGVGDIRTVTETDLLGRHEIETDVASIAGYLTGRRVLVTGAGGSIGSELCRQIHRFQPSSLVMLDRDESALQELQLSIEGRALLSTRQLVVCDIRDHAAVDAVFAEHQPEVVFHAAALKHLPLLEMWPAEAVKTNVFGTVNVLQSCIRANVLRFVNISTDKAADPTSVLGYTKRIAERLTASAVTPRDSVFLSVRFGNVLGSRGSVLSTFRAQIDAGGPVTVTDPEVTRYFMTIQEAVQLVVQAGAIGDSGEVLVLDMGSPARVAEVARRLAEGSGRRVEIIYTGLRPGEKLHEALFAADEHDVRPRHPLISHVTVPPIDVELIRELAVAPGASGLRDVLGAVCRSAPLDGRDVAGVRPIAALRAV
jgi:FlaA1/EpsC-like NDP-sugar epimerase